MVWGSGSGVYGFDVGRLGFARYWFRACRLLTPGPCSLASKVLEGGGEVGQAGYVLTWPWGIFGKERFGFRVREEWA